ncbi:predicted protein [Nematostella vectensis]|uniref:Potassium channel domain-containing protein n=1 Tax=Nematostella vectensis TaxID=45351 RepID=A7RWL0_NEMVE|nr:predicted protein [Nematostella vectensis]|eukprot:XP_001636247.1 predicted protein [Nematostella vectensis]
MASAEETEESNKFHFKSLATKIAIFICVLLVGASIFRIIERDKGLQTTHSNTENVKEEITSKYNISAKDLRKLFTAFEKELADATEARKPQWTFSNSVFLAFSIMTTIGYGYLTPKTWQGQLFCIFYSMVAIPVTGIMLISVGNHVTLALQRLISMLETRLLRREMPMNPQLKSTVVTFVFMVVIIISGALLTSHTDDWTFIEGMYFTFISLSTIGFGDYIINNGQLKDPDVQKTIAVNFTVVLITVGLCVVSSVLCSVSDLIEEKRKRMHVLSAAAALANSAPNKLSLRKTEARKNKKLETRRPLSTIEEASV